MINRTAAAILRSDAGSNNRGLCASRCVVCACANPDDRPAVGRPRVLNTRVYSDGVNNYAFWNNSPGVFRIKGDGVMAYYNPSFTKYTPGAANYERIVQQWNTSVAEIGTEAGGTGTQRALRLLGNGLNIQSATITAGGTVGAQTIDKVSGTVNFAAGASSLVVTNGLVTANSLVFGTVRTNDATCALKNIVPISGSFTITLTAACTAETSFGFLVINQ